jgi:hypothetical protein
MIVKEISIGESVRIVYPHNYLIRLKHNATPHTKTL